MKFKDMQYKHLDADEVKKTWAGIVEDMKNAKTYEEAKKVFLRSEEESKHLSTMANLAQIRHDIDTRDEFYDKESQYYNNLMPEIQEYFQQLNLALLNSPFRADFEKEYGKLMFINTEISLKTFSPEIIPLLQKEVKTSEDYENLLASAQIDFQGAKRTISQMTPFKSSPDDEVRLAAWKAEGQWYKDNQAKLDEYYDTLTHLRDEMGRKLGYDGYTQLGYYRMTRNCYTKEDVEKFRAAVVKYLVPIASEIFKEQAKRLGKEYPLSFADAELAFRSGNARPEGSADDVLAAGMKFYSNQSPETKEFFELMTRDELMDVLSTEGKRGGGYCTSIADYNCPFIFANFNGTAGDVEVVTHEAGHAFAAWLNRDRIPTSYIWPSLEACEVHSMSMEFFGEQYADDFFGKDARKFKYTHLADAIKFIPYGTMVDHFQHEVYEHPEYTPRQRHDIWKRLLGVYMPWLKLDGDIPFYSDGEGWQRQHHIYSMPFYYIDYCLAQTVSLEFWAMLQKDPKDAWEHYMAYAKQGGSQTFVDLLKNAGLDTPFEESCLRGVAEVAKKYLDEYDLTGLE